jgi:hypothetical protein
MELGEREKGKKNARAAHNVRCEGKEYKDVY